VTGVAVEVLPAASRATAVIVCVRGAGAWCPTSGCRRGRQLRSEVRPVDLELHAGDTRVVTCGSRDGNRRRTDEPATGVLIETVGGDVSAEPAATSGLNADVVELCEERSSCRMFLVE